MPDYDAVHAAISDLRKKQIFFVGGVIKSGTTWLQLLLDAHPQVSCKGEGHFMRLVPLLRRALDQHGQLIAEKNQTIFKELAGYPCLGAEDYQYLLASSIALYLLRQSETKSATRAVGEKSPRNLEFFDVFNALFPTVKFIHIVRDGRDCAVSGWFHNLRVTPEWVKKTYGSMEGYVTSFIDNWAKDVSAAQAVGDAHPMQVRQVRYEDLTANTERTLADLFNFLDVDASPSVLAECRSAASFERLSGGRAAGEENANSFFRKGVTGDWRNHLSPDVIATIHQRAGIWLDRFGYN
jgi:sulfotransferase family protein